MRQQDFTHALARLLSEPQLRESLQDDPARAARSLCADPADRAALRALDTVAIEEQAQSLLAKRRSEVARILPATWARLGPKADGRFGDYAEQAVWPQGHNRHLADAAAFCRYLHNRSRHDVVACEWNWVRFLAADRRFAVHFVRDMIVGGRPRWALQICYRSSRAVASQRAVYFGS